MMDENVIDQLFDRINNLEQLNRILEKEVIDVKVELEEKKINDLIKIEKIEEHKIISELDKYLDDEVNAKLFKSDNDLISVIIDYTPYDTVDKILIAGDFNKWEQEEMQKVIKFNISE
jgi:hypothetical protein